jgi:hypothetical protein
MMKELELNYNSCVFNVEKSMKYVKEMVENKEKELKGELELERNKKEKELNKVVNNLTELSDQIKGAWNILKESSTMPMFIYNSGSDYVNKVVELCEDKITSHLLNREPINTNLPKLPDLSSLNQVLSTITFNKLPTSISKLIQKEQTLKEDKKEKREKK